MSPAPDSAVAASRCKTVATRARAPLALLTLLTLTALLYARVADYPFLQWDDGVYVVERAALRRIAAAEPGAWRELLSPREALAGRSWEYLPLRDLSYGLDAWRAGIDPRAFHLTNLGLHLLAVLLVWGLARALSVDAGPALAATALFALHPLAVEPTAWISARKDLLYTTLALLGLLALLQARERQGRRRALALAAFAAATLAALGSKGPAVIIPLLAAVLVWRVFPEQARAGCRWPLVALGALAAAWAALALVIGQRSGIVGTAAASLGERLATAAAAPAHALALLAWPAHLSPSYRETAPPGWTQATPWIGLLLLLLLLLAALRATRRPRSVGNPLALAASLALCGWLALLPTAGLVRVAQARADRFLYLSLAFAALAGGALLHAAAPRPRRYLLFAAAAAALLGAAQTHRYLALWRHDLTLWRHVVASDPDHPLANGQLAALAIEQGQLAVAKRLLDRALLHGPALAPSWSNLGRWWQIQAGTDPLRPVEGLRAHQLGQAERAYRRAIALDRNFAPPYLQLASIARQRGDKAKAATLLRRALTLPRCPADVAQQLRALSPALR